MTPTASERDAIESAGELAPETHDALRDLILTLADSKRLLGIRYSDWMLGAPTLESGIAASSMAQDEWGHGRLTYALLSDFGEEPNHLEHGREADEYHSMEALDQPLRSWNELIAAALLLDTALATQFEALAESRYSPVHNRVQKLLDEEKLHFQHAAGWTRRIAAAPAVRDDFGAAITRFLPEALRWFGPADAPRTEQLVREGFVRADSNSLRHRFLQRIGPILNDTGFADALDLSEQNGEWSYTGDLDWTGWSECTRRTGGGGPDAETLARVRGDKNREMLLD